jgi:RNA polymerase sigma factor (sigma-70 family)
MSPTMTSQDDAALWKLLKQGDEAAFECLYKKYISDLLHYGERMGTGNEVLKDLVQDLFIEIWRSRDRIKETDSVKFYLFKALRYKMIRYYHHSNASAILHYDWTVVEESVENRLLHAEEEWLMTRQIQEAILKLPKRQQEIIHLRFFQGFSNQQIADLMNLQYQSTANLIHRSLQSMKQHLQVPAMSLIGLLFLLLS